MSDSEDSSDGNQVEKPVEEQKPDIPLDRKALPKRLRTRYWHSWEDMLFVDLWRQHMDEITCLDKNLPVFRKIAAGMRASGFQINPQEVQRKIKALKNQYITETRKLNQNEDKNAKSEWRLYTLVHCIMVPQKKNFDPNAEEKKLKEILERNQKDPLYHILLSGMPVVDTLQKIESGEIDTIPPPIQFENSFPAQNKMVADSIAYAYENKHKRSYTPRVRPSEAAVQRAIKNAAAADGKMMPPQASGIPTEERKPLQPANESAQFNRNIPSTINFGNLSLKSFATPESLKQIKLENRRLIDECVMDARRLKMEEQQLKAYENMLEQMHSQFRQKFL